MYVLPLNQQETLEDIISWLEVLYGDITVVTELQKTLYSHCKREEETVLQGL